MSNEPTTPVGTPAAELDITPELVHGLITTQHPDLSDLPLKSYASGWDNQLYRLGDDLLIRMPRREVAAQLILNEQIWLPEIAQRLPLRVPEPRRIGVPDESYPWHWSIVDWLPGNTVDREPLAADQASAWADFLLALHRNAPVDAPSNPVRGVPLTMRQAAVETRLARLAAGDAAPEAALVSIWDTALNAPNADSARWLHGDLHAQNVLSRNGAISAVIDWGDITSGDVATDLASIWALFEDQKARDEVLERYSPDQSTLQRARGWAFSFAVILLDSGLINSPRHAAQGDAALKRLAADI